MRDAETKICKRCQEVICDTCRFDGSDLCSTCSANICDKCLNGRIILGEHIQRRGSTPY